MSITFSTLRDKMKLFEFIREEGHLMMKDLIANVTSDERLNKIWIEHKLTTENLIIKRKLLELKRGGKIDGFRLRSGLFIVSGKNNQMIPSIYDTDQLNDIFPDDEQQNEIRNYKRNRPSASPEESTSKILKTVTVSSQRRSLNQN